MIRLALAGLAAAGGAALAWWLAASDPQTPGVLLSVGPAAKSDPYGVARGAVTHGEAVLIDFGDGDFVFFVNRTDEVRTLINGCGDRVAPDRQTQLPLLIDARFQIRNVPPYVVEVRGMRYRFEAPGSGGGQTCG
jgi:hypothetical protein